MVNATVFTYIGQLFSMLKTTVHPWISLKEPDQFMKSVTNTVMMIKSGRGVTTN